MLRKGFWSSCPPEMLPELLCSQLAAAWARLVFDTNFFQCVSSKGKADKLIALVNIINNILLLRDGPIKKFALHINQTDPEPQQSDLDRWCRFLSRNGVEELTLAACNEHKLPSCIVSCPTIKQLILYDFIFDLPINARCIFPGVTSLVFSGLEFRGNVNGIVYSIPNLENLTFHLCDGSSDFEISAPNPKRLTVIIEFISEVGSRWLWLHPKAIMTTLCLYCKCLKYEDEEDTLTFPTASNLQVMKLYEFSFFRAELWVTMQLLQKSPKLCELGIVISNVVKCPLEIEAASRLLEYPNGYITYQDLKLLKTIKIESFGGSTLEMLFVKMLLSRSPALESVIIQEYYDNDTMAVKVHRELLSFPRASPKAQIICMDQKPMYNLVCLPKFGN